jgi:hypothetical protein
MKLRTLLRLPLGLASAELGCTDLLNLDTLNRDAASGDVMRPTDLGATDAADEVGSVDAGVGRDVVDVLVVDGGPPHVAPTGCARRVRRQPRARG